MSNLPKTLCTGSRWWPTGLRAHPRLWTRSCGGLLLRIWQVLARTAFRWGAGDAEAGIRGWTYKRILVGYGGAAALTALTALFARGLVWLGPVAVLIDTVRRTRYKYRWAPKPSGWVLVPIGHIVSTYGSLVGFLTGYVRRGRRDLGL